MPVNVCPEKLLAHAVFQGCGYCRLNNGTFGFDLHSVRGRYCSLVQVSTITSRLASLPERLISVTSQSVVPVLVHSNIISRTVFLRMLRAFQQWGGRPKNDAQAAGADENSSVIENSEEDVQHMKRVQHLLCT